MSTKEMNEKDDHIITKPNLKAHQIHFIENQNNCSICGSHLNLNIENYYNEGLAREEAHCPHCNVKTRVKNHPLI